MPRDPLLLPQRVEPLLLRRLHLLLQLPDALLLVLLAAVQPRKSRDEDLDLLLLEYEVARELDEAGAEVVFREGVDCLWAG